MSEKMLGDKKPTYTECQLWQKLAAEVLGDCWQYCHRFVKNHTWWEGPAPSLSGRIEALLKPLGYTFENWRKTAGGELKRFVQEPKENGK